MSIKLPPHILIGPLVLLAVQLPFELDQPLVQIGGIAFTNVEATLLLVLMAALIVVWQKDIRWPPKLWMILGVWFVIALIVSALLAQELNDNALRAAFRTLTGIALALATQQLISSRHQLQTVFAALLLGGGLALLLGWLEVESGRAFNVLAPFRAAPSTAGPFVRLTGAFDYVNQATMFAEALLPITVVALISRWYARWMIGALLLILFAAIVLSLSRAAWVTGATVLGVAFIWRRIAQREWSWVWLIALGGLASIFVISMLRYPVFTLRLTTETDTVWYEVDIDVPADLTVQANDETEVRLTVRNQSPRNFRSDTVVPINIGVRWLDGETQLGEQRQALGRLEANSAESYIFELEAPPKAGNFQLQWDLVEENIAWFSDKTTRHFITNVTVEPSPPKANTSSTFSNPRPKPEPLPPDATRGTLWRVALEMWRDQPLTGVGLDNFRLLYGNNLGLTRWNNLLHTNNWYIETLVSLGLFGAIPFFAWQALLLNDIRRVTLARADLLAWATGLAIITFYIHGLLDYFLIFNSTGLQFWLLVGCWLVIRDAKHTI